MNRVGFGEGLTMFPEGQEISQSCKKLKLQDDNDQFRCIRIYRSKDENTTKPSDDNQNLFILKSQC